MAKQRARRQLQLEFSPCQHHQHDRLDRLGGHSCLSRCSKLSKLSKLNDLQLRHTHRWLSRFGKLNDPRPLHTLSSRSFNRCSKNPSPYNYRTLNPSYSHSRLSRCSLCHINLSSSPGTCSLRLSQLHKMCHSSNNLEILEILGHLTECNRTSICLASPCPTSRECSSRNRANIRHIRFSREDSSLNSHSISLAITSISLPRCSLSRCNANLSHSFSNLRLCNNSSTHLSNNHTLLCSGSLRGKANCSQHSSRYSHLRTLCSSNLLRYSKEILVKRDALKLVGVLQQLSSTWRMKMIKMKKMEKTMLTITRKRNRQNGQHVTSD